MENMRFNLLLAGFEDSFLVELGLLFLVVIDARIHFEDLSAVSWHLHESF